MPDFDWNNPELADKKTRESNWYRVKPGNRDIIQIVGKISQVRKHTYQKEGKFMTQMCSLEEHGECPFCVSLPNDPTIKDHRDDQSTWACGVFHVARQQMQAGAKPKPVLKLLAWRFGDDKKSQLLEVYHLTGGKLSEHQLSISLKGDGADDEKFQKVNINLMPKSIQLGPKQLEMQKVQLKRFAEVRKMYYPSPDDLRKFIKDSDEATSFDPEALGKEKEAFGGMDDPAEEEKPIPKKKKKAVEVEAESALDEMDDPLEGL